MKWRKKHSQLYLMLLSYSMAPYFYRPHASTTRQRHIATSPVWSPRHILSVHIPGMIPRSQQCLKTNTIISIILQKIIYKKHIFIVSKIHHCGGHQK